MTALGSWRIRVVIKAGSFVIFVSVDSVKVGIGMSLLILLCHDHRDWLERNGRLWGQ